MYATNYGGTSRFSLYRVGQDGVGNRDLQISGRMPSWSPDGSKIAYAASEDGGFFDIYTASTDGSDRRRLTETIENEFALVWSPDGSKIAYAVQASDGIRVINAEGSNATRVLVLSNVSVGAPTRSPDCRQIAFNSTLHRGDRATDPFGQYGIYKMSADG